MAIPFSLLLLLLFFFVVIVPFSESKLSVDYYKQTCPDFEKLMRETVTNKQITNPTTAAATLRLFFQDCMVEGCDASILVASNHLNTAEREANINLSLPGDAYDVVVRAKTVLELTCPGIVSCSDILAQATRDLLTMVGGPFYPVRLGRKDGFTSLATHVEGNIPIGNMTMDKIIDIFTKKGFTVEEMVALTGGGHTIGFSHCKEFSERLFHFNQTTNLDPDMSPKFAAALQNLCKDYMENQATSAFNDVLSPGKFDNMYFRNLPKGLGLLASDNTLVKDPRTRPIVDKYGANQSLFFQDFAHAMEKLSVYEIKTGNKGEVRSRCDQFNNIQIN